ncbi:MAG: PAS domain-containing protein [Anaerolineae bacterium]|nr:PAS domain-containing protein [Anaerolineae bacterium]
MTDKTTPPASYSERQQQARGTFGLIRALGTVREQLFRRSYQGKQAGTPSPAEAPTPPKSELLAQIEHRENQITHLTAILENIGEGVIMQDIDGRIIVMNDAAYKLLGSQKAFWESDLARLYQHADSPAAYAPGIEPLGTPVRVEINNRVLGAQVGAVSDDDGQRIGTLIVLRDVTRDALAERLKDDFITQISHELRTPLTAIKGMSDVLLSQPEDRPPNRRFLEAISRNVDVLDHMIVELLDISEISAGTFAVRQDPLDLVDLVWSVVRGLKPRLERAELEIHVLPINIRRCQLPGDNRRLRWALGHILENSINYTLPGGQITVRIGELRKGFLLVRIEDTGVGIQAHDLPHVRNRFYRGEALTTDKRTIDPRGLGQGLFIAQHVAEAHGGYLGIESKPGAGTLVTFALPAGGLTDLPGASPDDPEATVPNPALALPPQTDG